MPRFLLLLALSAFTFGAGAQSIPDPDEAFRFYLTRTGQQIKVHVEVLPGFAIYRNKLEFAAEGADIEVVEVPRGTERIDPYIGPTELMTGQWQANTRLSPSAEPVTLKVGYMGCQVDIFCYPPQHLTFELGVL